MDNAIIRTTNFTGIDNGVVYHLESMRPLQVAGRNILYPGDGAFSIISNQTTLFTDLDKIDAFSAIFYDSTSATSHVLGMSGSKIFDFVTIGANSAGLIHTVVNTGSSTDQVFGSQYPDIAVSTNGTILYTSSNHLGAAYAFKVTSANATSVTVSGKTFNATYGINATAGSNKVFNITKKEEYTNTTAAPTDTLNFTTAGTTPQANDIIVVFVDNFKKFNTQLIYNNHYSGQGTTDSWIRQIKFVGSDYWILNGNYVASLNIDMATFAATAKQLPYNSTATCFDGNNGLMLVGCDSQDGNGKLVLWDTTSEGFLSILNVERAPRAIRAYKSGWVVVIGTIVYYTDGYQIQELFRFPDQPGATALSPVHYNGVEIAGNKLYLSSSTSSDNRTRSGIYIYNTELGLSYLPWATAGGVRLRNSTAGAVKLLYSSTYALLSSSSSDSGNFKQINRIYSSAIDEYSATLFYDLPTKIRVNKVELKFNLSHNTSQTSVAYSTGITINYGDGNGPLYTQYTVSAGSSSSQIANTGGNTYPALVGQQILLLDGACSGERTYVTSTTNGGTTNEVINISPSLSTTPTAGSHYVRNNLYKSETKTITNSTLITNTTFNVNNFYSDKLYLEIVFKGDLLLELVGVNIY